MKNKHSRIKNIDKTKVIRADLLDLDFNLDLDLDLDFKNIFWFCDISVLVIFQFW